MRDNKTLSKWALSARSKAKMAGVHEDLKNVVSLALLLSPYDFAITSGVRSAEEQRALFASGKSNADGINAKSRHQTGHAVDFMVYDENGKGTWEWKYYKAVADAFKEAANQLDIPIVWGGDWTSIKDGPHIELKKSMYP